MILKEMSDMMGGMPQGNITFEKIYEIHRFAEFAAPWSENQRHWMFPQGIPEAIYNDLNLLYVQRIGRMGSESQPGYQEALQEYADLVKTVPGADINSINQILYT